MLLHRIFLCWLGAGLSLYAATPPKKPHVVVLGAVRQVPYSRGGDPAGAGPDESSLKTRALLVDGRVSEWTTGDAHDVTDRSFVVRRALRINDSLPGDTPNPDKGKTPGTHWVWQRGPWLLVDRVSGHVAALKLPDYDPAVSQVAWFRDYAAYCGVTPSGKSLYAVVAQIGVRKPALSKKLAPFEAVEGKWPACGLPSWQREPLRVTYHPAGKEAVSFDLAGSSAVLVEEGDGEEGKEAEAPAKP